MNILVVIFGLVALFSVIGLVQSFKERNVLSIIFNLASAVVFSGFTVLTEIFQGYPPTL